MANPDSQTTEKPAGYLELLRSNKNFRTLWLGQVISESGDWFSIVALLNLMLEVTVRSPGIIFAEAGDLPVAPASHTCRTPVRNGGTSGL